MGGEKDGKSFLRFNNSTKIETTNTGVVATGILTATSFSGGGLKLKDDGADSPILSVMADDGSPWAFQIGNSTYHDSMSTGTMIYNADTGVGYFNHRGNGAYKQFQFSLNDGSSSHRCITLEPSDQSVILYRGNSPQMQTIANGVSLHATTSTLLWPQNGNSNSRSWGWIGEDGLYGIFELKHSDTNDTVIDKKSIRAYATGSVYLYHNDNLKLRTQSTGVRVDGVIETNSTPQADPYAGFIARSSGANNHCGFFADAATGANAQAHLRFGYSGNAIWQWRVPMHVDGSGAGMWLYDYSVNQDVIKISQGGNQSIRGNIFPRSNNAYDLGSTSLRWANIYTNDLNLSNKGKTNDVDNTWGDYTIQEGESDLFLINNRSGKKYKFNLTEVS